MPSSVPSRRRETRRRAFDRLAQAAESRRDVTDLVAAAVADPELVHDLHLLISSVSLPEHLDVFERGICRRIDFAYAGPQSVRMAQMIADGTVEVGAIHTYVELYSRMFVDLIPNVVLLCAAQADRRKPLHRPEYRRHPDDRRSRRVQRRCGRRAGHGPPARRLGRARR